MDGNLALTWLATFRSERSRRATPDVFERWREHRRAPGRDAEELLDGLAARLTDMGMGVLQCCTTLLPLHPEIFAVNLVWTRGEGVKRHDRTHEFVALGDSTGTPVTRIKRGSGPIRVRLDTGAPLLPVMAEMAARGGTEFFIMPLVLGDGRRSWSQACRAR